jgi:predicted phosphoribosyltransferase
MYFQSRKQAGQILAEQLFTKYRYKNCTVLALDDGGAVIGSEIAKKIHCNLSITVSEEIDLPREPWSVGGITPDGQFISNSQYTEADLAELEQENRSYIEEEKLAKFHIINSMVGSGGTVSRQTLAGHNVIITSDGLPNTYKLDVALAFIKVVRYEKIIIAIPLASVEVVDWMHIHADDIYCLSVVENYSDTDHYYEVKDIPSRDKINQILNANILNWE